MLQTCKPGSVMLPRQHLLSFI